MYEPPTHRFRMHAGIARQVNATRQLCELDFKRTITYRDTYDHIPGRCRVCGEKVRGRRTTYCSGECAEYQCRLGSWSDMRAWVFERDGRSCRDCGDTTFKRGYKCDHIIPVHRGGGQLGPDNLQTLCRTCHRRKTAREAAARGKPKRESVSVDQLVLSQHAELPQPSGSRVGA